MIRKGVFMRVHKVMLALGILALGGIAAFGADPWKSQVTSATIQIIPAVKSMDEALTAIPVDTTRWGHVIVIR